MFQDMLYLMNWTFLSKSFSPHLPLLLFFILYLIFFFSVSSFPSTTSPQSSSTSFQTGPLSPTTPFFVSYSKLPSDHQSSPHSIPLNSSSSSTNSNFLPNYDSSPLLPPPPLFPSSVVSPLCPSDTSISPQSPIIHRSPTSSNIHPMFTRSKHGIHKPTLYNLSTLATSNSILTEPTTYQQDSQHSVWQ